MNHLHEPKVLHRVVERATRHGDLHFLMSIPDVMSRIAEWGREYPILLTLQVRTGALSTALREFGTMCMRGENYELAAEVFLAAVSMKPDDCWLWQNLSSAYLGATSDTRALHCIRRALDLNNSHAGIWLQYGVLLRDMGQAKPAESAFIRAVALDADDVEARYALGSLLLDSCRFSEAAELFEVCLRAETNDRLYHSKLGYARYMSGKFEDSAFHYRAAAAMVPLDKESLRRYAKSVAFRLALAGAGEQALDTYTALAGVEAETLDDVMKDGVAILCANDLLEEAVGLQVRLSQLMAERQR
jgi:tetratricopeptide (TPR) repeat protein